MLLVLAIFLAGRWRLRQRSKLPRSRTWLFLGGWLVLALSLVSPLHEGGERSFTLHMIEHELIMLVATFLLAAASAGGTLAWGLPAPLRRALGGSWKAPLSSLWRRLTQPVTATIVQALAMWAWHAPVQSSAHQPGLARRAAPELHPRIALLLAGDVGRAARKRIAVGLAAVPDLAG
jgi:cytochrome c oxidase assembly factor CtaG